jgi:hypothetical protein
MQIVAIEFAFDIQARYIESGSLRIAPVPVNSRAVDTKS